MGSTAARFKAEVLRRLDEVFDGQEDAVHEAAVIFADTIERGGIIRAFGSGHSHANALEIRRHHPRLWLRPQPRQRAGDLRARRRLHPDQGGA